MVTLLWALQILFGLFFALHGVLLVAKPTAMRAQLEESPFPSGFLSFIGICESLGGLGLILPMWTGIVPWLTPLAAAGLAIIMAGAVWSHVSSREVPQIGVTGLITLAVAFIAFARWPLLRGLL